MNRAEQIRELRRSGQSLKQIAQIVGCDKAYCSQVCRAAGMGGAIIEQRLTESQVADYVSRSGFDYVSGYQSQKKPITVRCRQCGRTFERQFHIFRDVATGTWQCGNECPLCRSDRQEAIKRKRQEEAEREAQQKAADKAERLSREANEELQKRLAIHVCKNCGKEYCQMTTGYNSTNYCSEACQVRWNGRRQRDKRVKRMMTGEHDSDITLEKLYQRDGGVCYLCGAKCNWTDGEVRNGTFVAGQTYPSIDHVRPLSKGGRHTWSNVKLACRGCNSRKRNLEPCPQYRQKT